MEQQNVVYIGTYLTEPLQDSYDWDQHSPAGQTKQESTVSALSRAGYDVDVVSSTVIADDTVGANRTVVDSSDTATVYVSPMIRIVHKALPPGLRRVVAAIQNKFILTLSSTLLLLRLSLRTEYDAIVFYNFNLVTSVPAFVASLLFGTPLVIEYSDSRADSASRADRIKDSIYLTVIGRRVSGAIYINAHMAELLGTDKQTVVRGTPSIELTEDDLRSEQSRSPLTIFYGGRLDDVRGVSKLVRLAPDLISELDVEIRITGYGPKSDAVAREVERIDSERVDFLGFISKEQYKSELLTSDVALNLQSPSAPGNRYTFPTKILDYLATGNVVVSTKMSDLERELDDVLVFTEPKTPQIYDTIESAVSNYAELSARSERGVEWIQRECSPEKRTEDISRLLDEVCA